MRGASGARAWTGYRKRLEFFEGKNNTKKKKKRRRSIARVSCQVTYRSARGRRIARGMRTRRTGCSVCVSRGTGWGSGSWASVRSEGGDAVVSVIGSSRSQSTTDGSSDNNPFFVASVWRERGGARRGVATGSTAVRATRFVVSKHTWHRLRARGRRGGGDPTPRRPRCRSRDPSHLCRSSVFMAFPTRHA